ncbi:response regulator receiver [Methanosarcina horonobensis HB-1 = JCM 15518]|uniref:Response regulator receiver n=1 Tax=Methanosarcina horonobensis HB-1 = JCM 15518 TaxID=1434110 RepID=A0A0E3SCU0_9EURY|nr:response regulator [Methanosarcina horonobensis]AKB78711.1 response regulator receiver [Methanosarcina horonobensis HB-1 = JCM 15518]
MAEGRILIVEDEHIVAMGIKRMLKGLGYTVTGVASSGEDAISKAESTFPDLVLMDIMLKGELDGVEAAKEIKERFDVPVVYLTAYSDSNILERVKKTGPFGYIVKPFDEKDLHSNIEIALHRYRKEKLEGRTEE